MLPARTFLSISFQPTFTEMILRKDVFGTDESIPRDRMVCRAVKKVHDQIQSSARPGLPLIWSEFNASYANEPAVTDTAYMGPWMADTIRQCDGLVNIMSYWTFLRRV